MGGGVPLPRGCGLEPPAAGAAATRARLSVTDPTAGLPGPVGPVESEPAEHLRRQVRGTHSHSARLLLSGESPPGHHSRCLRSRWMIGSSPTAALTWWTR